MAADFPAPLLFHGPGLLARLTLNRGGRCLLSLTQTGPGSSNATLAVIHQPTDERGLARGFAATLYERQFSFASIASGQPQAFVWLPENISWEFACRCYYRVTFTARHSNQ